ncbi:tetratricopeptide repeat protein [Mesosutterella porci]|uniref:tetratricopeptide repeat protein n=1 Tax=Mesosutterella porci TaxID=2915351 RepID=UPI0024B4D7D3|nr:tetratricopeptide repeat protein [Mesosutterella sp. oilRF-744-WT-GAM-9]
MTQKTEKGEWRAQGARRAGEKLEFVYPRTRREAARECLGRAALGDRRAQYEAGSRLERGDGVEPDCEKAFEWYCRSAQAGYGPACSKAALYCLEGLAGRRDVARGIAFLERGAGSGDAVCLLLKGECCMKGVGRKVSRSEALRCFELAAASGLPSVQYRAGLRCLEGDEGYALDLKKGMAWLTSAARHGFSQAALELGRMRLEGRLVRKSGREALRWFVLAAREGSAEALLEQGRLLLSGRGGASSPRRGLACLRAASERGLAEASELLGDPLLKAGRCGRGPEASDRAVNEKA